MAARDGALPECPTPIHQTLVGFSAFFDPRPNSLQTELADRPQSYRSLCFNPLLTLPHVSLLACFKNGVYSCGVLGNVVII